MELTSSGTTALTPVRGPPGNMQTHRHVSAAVLSPHVAIRPLTVSGYSITSVDLHGNGSKRLRLVLHVGGWPYKPDFWQWFHHPDEYEDVLRSARQAVGMDFDDACELLCPF